MSQYRRFYRNGGWYFFTVVTYQRRRILVLPDNIRRLRAAFKKTMDNHPFWMDGVVVLPDHIHCIWRLPEDDEDFSLRWRLIKKHFSTGIDSIPDAKGEKHVWQRRFWEHLIKDEEDWRRHMDYIHYNPVKHGYVPRPVEWEFGSFARAVERGWYRRDWGSSEVESIREMDLE
ncbi:MAG: transposase [Proteobacteria bacterium]|nr:transposase [Pseudomonadota bacterium]